MFDGGSGPLRAAVVRQSQERQRMDMRTKQKTDPAGRILLILLLLVCMAVPAGRGVAAEDTGNTLTVHRVMTEPELLWDGKSYNPAVPLSEQVEISYREIPLAEGEIFLYPGEAGSDTESFARWLQKGGAPLLRAQTDESGTCTFTHLPDGSYWIAAAETDRYRSLPAYVTIPLMKDGGKLSDLHIYLKSEEKKTPSDGDGGGDKPQDGAQGPQTGDTHSGWTLLWSLSALIGLGLILYILRRRRTDRKERD